MILVPKLILFTCMFEKMHFLQPILSVASATAAIVRHQAGNDQGKCDNQDAHAQRPRQHHPSCSPFFHLPCPVAAAKK